MELIGEKVNSAKFGNGVVTAFDGEIIGISFADCDKKFSFLKCVELGSVVFENPEIQKAANILVYRDKQKNEEMSRARYSFNSHSDTSNSPVKLKTKEEELLEKLRNKIIANQSIAIDLIDHYDNKAFEDFLFKRSFSVMKTIINNGKEKHYSERGRALIIVAITYLALKYYDAGNLESFIYEKYIEYNYGENKEAAIESKEIVISKGFWRAIKNKNNLFDYRKITMYKDQTSYVAVPLVLSVVPHYRMKDLFDFAKDIYKKKLLFCEDISDDLLYGKINETLDDLKLKNIITDKYDDKKIGDYLLCAYTKCCIQTGKCQDDLVLIIGQCIKIIINYLTLPEDAYVVPPFYKDGFLKWSSNFNEKDVFEENVILSRPAFYLSFGKNIFIKTGRICMDSRFDPNTVQLIVYSDGKEIDRKLLNGANDIEYDYKDDIVGGYIINRIDYQLKKSPLKNISYSIIANGQTIYSSKDYLFRTNIFFDERGYEVKPGYKYDGEIKVITKEEQYTDDYELTKLYSFEDYFIYSAVVDDQTSYEFDGNSYVFYKIENPEILGYAIPWAFIECDDKKYKIYKDHSFIFRIASTIEGIYYILDGKKYDFGDNDDDHSISIYAKEHHDYNTYIIKINHLNSGFHSLKIYTYDNDEKIKNGTFNFISDSKFGRKVERQETGRLFTYSSDFLRGDTVLFYENGCSNKSLDVFVPELGYSSLILLPSDFSYSVDGEKWFDRDNKIMLCSIPSSTSKIAVCGPDQAKAFFLDANKERQYLTLASEGENKYVYNLYLSHLRDLAMNGLKEKRVYLEAGNKPKYVLFRFVPYVSRDESIFSYNEQLNTHVFKIVFEGCDYVWAKIKPLNNNEKVYLSKKIKSGEVLSLVDSDIDESVSSLSVSLYMIKGNALVQKPFDEPFMTFEKYKIPSRIVSFDEPENPCNMWFEDNNKYLCIQTFFKGPKNISLLIVPTGKTFEGVVLLNKQISSGELIKFDISSLLFNSYFIRLLNVGEGVNSKWLFRGKIDNDKNPFLGKTFSVIKYESPSKELYPSNIAIRTKTIKCIYGICLIAADVFRGSTREYEEYLLNVVNINDNSITFRLCGEIPCHGTGTPKSKSGNELIIVRRD